MEPERRTIRGTVARARIAPGSKSDRVGVVLRADDGEEYVLRRRGGNAFRDPTLEQLVGSVIRATGSTADRHFLMDDWDVEGGR
jgi:hypothetical protein